MVRYPASWLMVDKAGFVTDVWVGKLDSTGEEQVLRAVNGGHGGEQLLGSQPFRQ